MIVQMFMLFNIVYGNYLNTDYQKILYQWMMIIS